MSLGNGNGPDEPEVEGPAVEFIVTAGALAAAVEKGAAELDVVMHIIGTALGEAFDGDPLSVTLIGWARLASGDVRIGIERPDAGASDG